jgi:RecB family endonuclease NucS
MLYRLSPRTGSPKGSPNRCQSSQGRGLCAALLALSATLVNSDGVEQLTRYLELLNRDPLLAPVQGIFAAQEIKPQARVLAQDRGIRCLTLDYDTMRGTDDGALRLF